MTLCRLGWWDVVGEREKEGALETEVVCSLHSVSPGLTSPLEIDLFAQCWLSVCLGGGALFMTIICCLYIDCCPPQRNNQLCIQVYFLEQVKLGPGTVVCAKG